MLCLCDRLAIEYSHHRDSILKRGAQTEAEPPGTPGVRHETAKSKQTAQHLFGTVLIPYKQEADLLWFESYKRGYGAGRGRFDEEKEDTISRLEER